jgi:hypothetical protein
MVDEVKSEKAIFQLNEFIRHLLIDSNDVEKSRLKYWIDYWTKIEKENEEIFVQLYKIK